jgi:actin-related protein
MGGTLGRFAEKGPKDKVTIKDVESSVRLPIDEAVIKSIQQVGNPELYPKLFSGVVLAGGSTMFPYFGKALEEMFVVFVCLFLSFLIEEIN